MIRWEPNRAAIHSEITCVNAIVKIAQRGGRDLFIFIFIIFSLEYSCFTLLCLLGSKVNRPYKYKYPLFSGFSTHLGDPECGLEFPELYSRF